MSVETPAPVATPKPQAGEGTQDGKPPQPPQDGTEDLAALRSRLAFLESEKQSANKEAQGLRKRLREIETAQQAAEKKALEEKGQWKELSEKQQKELEASRQELESLRIFKVSEEQRKAEQQAREEALVATEFAKLPADWQGIAGAEATLRERQIAINAYRAARGSGAPPMPAPAAKPAAGAPLGPPEPSDAELIELGGTTDPKRKRELGDKLRAYNDWANTQKT
jgi:hypothetical protein